MKSVFSAARLGTVCCLVATFLVAAAWAQEEEKKTGWSDAAELAYVLTSGNSESTTLGFKNTATRDWEKATLVIKAGGTRVETTKITDRTVTLDPNGVIIDQTVEKETETTAEIYYLNGRYGRKVTERFFWYIGAGWDRNRPSGVQNRYVAEAGAGHTWYERDDLKFRTGYAATYTDQEDVIPNPDIDETFGGVRVSWGYLNKFGSNTTYENILIFDYNLSESEDWRADMVNSLAVAMTERLALKVSLQWLYDNLPSMTVATVTNPPPLTAQVALDELDTIFNVSLVVNF
jgi:hypothetical protein